MNRRSNYTSIAGRALLVLALLAISLSAFAQLPGVGGVAAYAPPFDTTGFIQDAGLGAPGTKSTTFASVPRNSGGWLITNSTMIVIPANATLQMPATEVAWADLFDSTAQPAGNPYGGDVTAGGTQTGMAMLDAAPKLPGTYEVHIQGNIVNGQYIAGLIFIAPQSLNLQNGFISHIDYANGDLYVNGGPGGAETRIQINDPIGRFGKAHSPDERFTVDEDNPTIHAETGYPMCVPRFDPAVQADNLCPQYNRPVNPLGGYLMNYTMGDPRLRAAGQPDAYLMAPFEVGDYITYSGMLVPGTGNGANGGFSISAYNIEANVGIYTAPLTDPVYVVLAEMEQGTGGTANVAFPQETTSRVKVEGMATDSDPGRFVQIGARDTDCNGVVSDRAPWLSALPIDPGPPTGAKRGRIRWRPNGGAFLPPGKEVHVIASGANTATPTKNGLFPGQYFAPQFTFIFPEGLAVGDPPVTLNLSDFVWLANGIGPFGETAPGSGVPLIIGQLSPFPDLNAPPVVCSYNAAAANSVVTADAGGPYSIALNVSGAGSTTLSGATASGPVAGLTYRWIILNQQPAGSPQLTLDGGSVATSLNPVAAIAASAASAALTTPLTFQVSFVATNPADPTHPSTASVTTITVNPPVRPPVVSSLTLTPSTVNFANTFTATASAFDPAGTALTYAFSAAPTCATPGLQTGASQQFTASSTAQTCSISVTVSNAAGATASLSSPLVIKAPAGAPTITSVTATPNPVVSNGSVRLSAVASDPNNLALTYAWTLTNANGTLFASLTGATPTFTAPTATPATGPVRLTISLVVTNSSGQASLAKTTTLTVNPPAGDTLANNGTLYRTTKSRLTINVTSSVVSPSIVITVTLDLINPATGLPWTATLQNLGGGAYTADLIGVGLPNTIRAVSTGGGTLTITQAQIAVRQ